MDKDTIPIIGLILLGLASLYFQKYEVTATCVGAIAGYVTQKPNQQNQQIDAA